ncbi:DUF6468 domain-containing protein [Sneathiella glossodoripedis]|uniref:DUF6468 domain-containing protein n=1 Tax=Sneathiella glossodoripedis TaxID=418853 RepID=UPI00047166C8|nr:DUF6468 domain-containing protein [Sneathiella glossodoripedis]
MEFLSIPLILDLILIVMLAACIAYCVSLNKKLSVMRDAQSEMQKVAKQFDQAIVKSKLGIEELKKASKDVGGALQSEIDEAKTLVEELKLIQASSSRIADRLQESVGGVGQKINTPKESLSEDKADEEVVIEPRTDAERELLEMLTKSK